MQKADPIQTDISIIICTYNRADTLSNTLNSFIKTSKQNITYEILVIDNNSTDMTKNVCMSYRGIDSNIQYHFEQKQGLSEARNTGVKISKGKIIAFADDDVHFDHMWLSEVKRIFDDFPDASCMGGKSLPHFESGRPTWIVDDFLSLYGSTNSGDKTKWMIYPEYPFGLNMAFDRTVFEKIGFFNPNLGRKRKNLLSNEECEFFWRAKQANLKVIYNPKAILFHQIPIERTSKDWIINRFYWQGISSVIFDQLVAPESKSTLLKKGIILIWDLTRHATGGYLTPRKAYWHYKSIKLPEKCEFFFKAGMAKQLILEFIKIT